MVLGRPQGRRCRVSKKVKVLGDTQVSVGEYFYYRDRSLTNFPIDRLTIAAGPLLRHFLLFLTLALLLLLLQMSKKRRWGQRVLSSGEGKSGKRSVTQSENEGSHGSGKHNGNQIHTHDVGLRRVE